MTVYRIELGVLSVVAQQILIIQQAKAAKIKEFYFEGKEPYILLQPVEA